MVAGEVAVSSVAADVVEVEVVAAQVVVVAAVDEVSEVAGDVVGTFA